MALRSTLVRSSALAAVMAIALAPTTAFADEDVKLPGQGDAFDYGDQHYQWVGTDAAGVKVGAAQIGCTDAGERTAVFALTNLSNAPVQVVAGGYDYPLAESATGWVTTPLVHQEEELFWDWNAALQIVVDGVPRGYVFADTDQDCSTLPPASSLTNVPVDPNGMGSSLYDLIGSPEHPAEQDPGQAPIGEPTADPTTDPTAQPTGEETTAVPPEDAGQPLGPRVQTGTATQGDDADVRALGLAGLAGAVVGAGSIALVTARRGR